MYLPRNLSILWAFRTQWRAYQTPNSPWCNGTSVCTDGKRFFMLGLYSVTVVKPAIGPLLGDRIISENGMIIN
jgi:hypothetical protein